ncbi:MAG TPA: hypothetical protein VK206_08120 [Anaerolineales bacterium]|nr:hypothetical protein [Anaerolineales bacterium]HLO30296.1 hypothetical protein [Anaerolineales bacterium]
MVNVLIKWLIFLHVLSALTFFLAHGTSAAMAFKVRRETDFSRIRAMLDLSDSTVEIMFLSFLGLVLTGLALPFFIHIWNKGWVWLSIVLMVFVFIWMVRMNERSYKDLRKLVGLPYRRGSKEYPAEVPAGTEEVVTLLKQIKIINLVVVGYIIPAFVLWLMIFKPF